MAAAANLLTRAAEDLSRTLQSLWDEWLARSEGEPPVEAWELYANVEGALTYLSQIENLLMRLKTHRSSLEATAEAGRDEFHKQAPKTPKGW